MKVLLPLITRAYLTKGEETPNFSLIQERLDNGIPSIAITFSDGYSDLLVLNHFYDRDNRPEGCHFMGHLENEPNSCMGMTGCIGIMSEHATGSGSYTWNKDGTVDNLKHPLENGMNDKTIPYNNFDEKIEELSVHDENDREVKLAPFMTLQIGVVYDDSILKKLKSHEEVKKYRNKTLVHVQAKFCHPSLGAKIKIDVTDIKHMAGKSIYIRDEDRHHYYDTAGEYTKVRISIMF